MTAALLLLLTPFVCCHVLAAASATSANTKNADADSPNDEATNPFLLRHRKLQPPPEAGPLKCKPYLLLATPDPDGAGATTTPPKERSEWVCETFEEDELSGTPLVYQLKGNINQGYFVSNRVKSGRDAVIFTVATKSRGRDASGGMVPDTIFVHPGSQTEIVRGGAVGNNGGRHRKLAQKTGDSDVLLVRVGTPVSPAEDVSRSAVALSSDCFGIGAPGE